MGTTPAALLGGVVAVVAVAMAAVLVWGRTSSPAPEVSIPLATSTSVETGPSTSTTAPGSGEVMVHAAGAVARPGVYVLGPDARIGDVLAAAGGPVEGADLDRLNLAAGVADGSRVYVPRRDEPEPPRVLDPDGDVQASGSASGDAGPGGDLVELNTADAASLETLPGIGPATAAAILAHRDEHGPFAVVEDLLDVRGIGDAKLEALRDLVEV